jgi:Mrp family chromosome partitioning ATPase
LLNREDAVLVAPEDNPKEIIPIEYEGIKSMSFGYAKKNRAIMRGPMVSSIVTQLVYQTNWGDLDYLVVDMPPGKQYQLLNRNWRYINNSLLRT